MSILLSDLRGFSSMSDSLAPDQVVSILLVATGQREHPHAREELTRAHSWAPATTSAQTPT